MTRWDIFVSYRRSDSADVTGRICDQIKVLRDEECVFRDVDSIPLGRDFRQAISEAVGQCEVLLAIIGKDWLAAGDDGKRRIDDANDYVHIEIAAALGRGIPVVPVLVENTPMPPAADLPEPLRELAFRNGTPVRPDPDFHHDVSRLCSQLTQYLPKVRTGPRRIWANTKARLALCAAGGAAILAIVLFAAMSVFQPDTPAPSAPSSSASQAPVAGSPVPVRFWVEALPDVPGADPEKLFNNALGSWQAVVVSSIRKADSAAEANVLVITASDAKADVSQIGPPKSGGARLIIRFGTTEPWTPRTFEAASARMLGHILGLAYTATPDQLMTDPNYTTLETLPLTPQSEDIKRVRQLWGE